MMYNFWIFTVRQVVEKIRGKKNILYSVHTWFLIWSNRMSLVYITSDKKCLPQTPRYQFTVMYGGFRCLPTGPPSCREVPVSRPVVLLIFSFYPKNRKLSLFYSLLNLGFSSNNAADPVRVGLHPRVDARALLVTATNPETDNADLQFEQNSPLTYRINITR